MIHLCKLRHRKKALEHFRKFISQEQYIKVPLRSTQTPSVLKFKAKRPEVNVCEILKP